MPNLNNRQNVPGVIKPTQQRYASARVVRHIRLDDPTEATLQQAIAVLSGTDRVSIGLLLRRAVQLYGASLLARPDGVEAEREAVRKGARKAKAIN